MNNLHTTFKTLFRKMYTFVGLSLALGVFAGWQWLYGVMGAYGLVLGVVGVLIATEWWERKLGEMWFRMKLSMTGARRFEDENVVDFERRRKKVGVDR